LRPHPNGRALLSELYFRRAGLFGDGEEDLPPEDYLPDAGLNPRDINDALQLSHFRASLAQNGSRFCKLLVRFRRTNDKHVETVR
jgi:hypothetical protein